MIISRMTPSNRSFLNGMGARVFCGIVAGGAWCKVRLKVAGAVGDVWWS